MKHFFIIRPVIYRINKVFIAIIGCAAILYITYFEYWNLPTIKYISLLSFCILISFASDVILAYDNTTFQLKKGLRIFQLNINFSTVGNVQKASQILIKRFKINFNHSSARIKSPTQHFHYIYKAYIKYPDIESLMIGTSRNRDEFFSELTQLGFIIKVPVKIIE